MRHKNETNTIPLHAWNEIMRIEWLHQRQARMRKTVAVMFFIWPAFSYFFRFIWSGNQGVSVSVLRMVMPTERRGRTNITNKLGSIEPVRMQKVKRMGRRGTINIPTIWFILFCFIYFLSSIEPVRRRKLKSPRDYRYVEWQHRACNPVLTVQQKSSKGYQHSHFCGRSINRLYMGMANGELAVMYATISYRTYSGIHRCDLAHTTNYRVGGSGI